MASIGNLSPSSLIAFNDSALAGLAQFDRRLLGSNVRIA
jgi:hypothetical protein